MQSWASEGMFSGGSGFKMAPRYAQELLPNGLVRVRSKESGLIGLWDTEGQAHSGDLTRTLDASEIGYWVRSRWLEG